MLYSLLVVGVFTFLTAVFILPILLIVFTLKKVIHGLCTTFAHQSKKGLVMNHIPVLREAVQKYISLGSGDVVVDATLGLGGHASDMAAAVGEKGRVIAFDQDERNLVEAKKRLESYGNVTFVHSNFRHLKNRISELGIDSIDAILFDLGLSSPHVDDPERGFSFMKDGPLDMRFDPREDLTAHIVVNTYTEAELTRVFREYGEEPMAKKFAAMICKRRADRTFESTAELANYLSFLIPKKYQKGKSHPATRVFQAIRMEVNAEMEVLEEALDQAFELLKPDGKIVVISYHSIEDRVVKRFFQKLERPELTDEAKLLYQAYGDPLVEKITRKPVVPAAEELEENPRSRSAKLRAYKKI